MKTTDKKNDNSINQLDWQQYFDAVPSHTHNNYQQFFVYQSTIYLQGSRVYHDQHH